MYFSITVGEVCPFNGTLTYSSGYAQQVQYPHHAQEVGSLFSKLQRKCQVFGICAEGAGTVFILTNVVVVHVYVFKEKNHLFTQNCKISDAVHQLILQACIT